MTIFSYSKLYNFGHHAIKDIFNNPVTIEEKIDGSQFSFGVYDGVLKARSKGAQLSFEHPEKMFGQGLLYVKSIQDKLVDGWTYRGEYLQKPKHNTLAYDRIPNNHIMIYDIDKGNQNYFTYEGKVKEAARIGLETVPLIFEGVINTQAEFSAYLETISVLGGQKVEGVVVKNYSLYEPIEKKIMMGKYVSEAFKEVHSKVWAGANPGGEDFIQLLIYQYRTPARWNKAIQHLQEAGVLKHCPSDIPLLMKETASDVFKECEEEIKQKLFAYAWPKISRGVIKGLPEFYKETLLSSQFE